MNDTETHLLGDIAIRITASHREADLSCRLSNGAGSLTVMEIQTNRTLDVEISLSLPLGDAVGFWHPTSGLQRTLAPESTAAARVSLVSGAVTGCLFDNDGRCRMAFAAADVVSETEMRHGVSEEGKTFVAKIKARLGRGESYVLALVGPAATQSVAQSFRVLRAWLREHMDEPALATPSSARLPAYSTWYAFHQDVEAAAVEQEAELAATAGCAVLILDDGWQQFAHDRSYAGCGGWRPDPVKFPDLAGHVHQVRATGMRYLLWIAPLLLGVDSEMYPTWSQYASAPATARGAYVLDPRYPQVRRHVVDLCMRLMGEFELDGLKIDFLDEAMVYAADDSPPPSGSDRDLVDVGDAMRVLLTALRDQLAARPSGDAPLIELRQPYVGPGMTAFGNMLRAGDCPGDATINRTSTIDVGMLAIGGAVHSDMLMWAPSAQAHAVARQLIGAFHSVPQISMRLSRLSDEHLAVLSFWLRQWRGLRPLLLDGEIEPGRPDELYAVVCASAGDSCVVSAFADRVVRVDTHRHRLIHVINATALPRLVLEVAVPGGLVDIVVHQATGGIVELGRKALAPGLNQLSVPPSGLAVLRLVDPV